MNSSLKLGIELSGSTTPALHFKFSMDLSSLSFIKSKLRNKLDKNLDTCIRLYIFSYALDYFMIERVVHIWFFATQRRGANNYEKNAPTEKYMPIKKEIIIEKVIQGFEFEIPK